MNPSKLRRKIAWQAARLMYDRHEAEYYQAKMKAARRVCKGWVKPADLPSNAEIRDQVLQMARVFDAQRQSDALRQMRIEALRILLLLQRFRPRLIGSVLTGHIREGSDVDIHCFADALSAVTAALEYDGLKFEVQRKRITKSGRNQTYRHVHVVDRFPVEITVYPANMAQHVFKSSITGKPIERASAAELQQLLGREYPGMDVPNELVEAESAIDRFQLYYSLLLPLENVKQNPAYHPEGDALYHSLQVFDRACDRLPYDEEFLLAALLHDVGKAINPTDHVRAGLEALEGFVPPRTSWLIAHHMDARRVKEGTLGHRAQRRLREDESYDELMLLAECDALGRVAGVQASELDEALDYIRGIADTFA